MSIRKHDEKMKFSFQNKVIFYGKIRKDTTDVQFFMPDVLTINGEERKLPIKALKERATEPRQSETRRSVRAAGRVRQLSLRSRKEESESK